MLVLIPSPNPVDVTFILSREDSAVMEEFRAADLEYDGEAPAPYHLWAFFFRKAVSPIPWMVSVHVSIPTVPRPRPSSPPVKAAEKTLPKEECP